jgi:hypothetical protein
MVRQQVLAMSPSTLKAQPEDEVKATKSESSSSKVRVVRNSLSASADCIRPFALLVVPVAGIGKLKEP